MEAPGAVADKGREKMKLPRTIVADDHALLTESLRKLLEPHCEIVATVADGRALLKAAKELKPELIVLDIGMPRMNGFDAGRQLREMMPAIKLLFLTMNEDPDLAVEAMRMKASGYLLKTSAASELFDAIRAALRGKSYITPCIVRGMQEIFIRHPEGSKQTKKLTPRQREVLQLTAEGKSMKETADILNITPRTVAFHKYHMMEELGLKTSAALVQFAIKHNIVAA
jgi:DNA-binding NarL/FixJ family response regulator